MKICPECGDVYPAQATVCRAHGTPLRDWSDSTEVFAAAHTDVEESSPDDPELSISGETEEHTTPEFEQGAANRVSPTAFTPPVQVDPEALLRTGPPRGGRTLADRYRLDRQIGIGGYGAVFDAYDKRLRKRVAVKVLSPALSQSPEEIERFRREAVAASRVQHEGIVDVTDLNRDVDGTFFIVMEYLGGVDLGDVLDAYGSLEPVRALEIAEQCANALAAAHEVGIVHRDLKPANIFLTTTRSRADTVKIIDFGISKVIHQAGEGADLTSASKTVGTPAFMSPEQARRGGKLDGRADIYALGIILFVMLTGELPFKGDSAIEILTNHITQPRVPPSEVSPELKEHPELDELVLRAIAIEPSHRYQSMGELSKAIGACAARLRAMAKEGAPAARREARDRTVPVTPLPSPRAAAAGKQPSFDASSGEVTLLHRAAPSRRRRGALVAVVVASVGIGAGVWLVQRGASRGASDEDSTSTSAESKRSVAAPEPAAESEPAAVPEPAAESEPAAVPEPATVPELAAESEPAAALANRPRTKPKPHRAALSRRKSRGKPKPKSAPTNPAKTSTEPAAKTEPEGTIAVEEW